MMQDTVDAYETYVSLMNRVMHQSPRGTRAFSWVLPFGETTG